MQTPITGRSGFSLGEMNALDGFEGELKRDVNILINSAKRLQLNAGRKGRVHVLYEVLEDRTDARGIGEFSMTEMRILFSESIKFSDGDKYTSANFRLAASVALFGMLHSQELTDRGLATVAGNADVHREVISIPSWYPGKEYEEGMQVSTAECLKVSAQNLRVMEVLSDEQVGNVYNEIFQKLHDIFVAEDISLHCGRMKYSRFTVPWIRRNVPLRIRFWY